MSQLLFEAVIFDLDGVITKTALVHSRAWKEMFDDFLLTRSKENKEDFKEFTHVDDYLPYVDGKPRHEGIISFLLSRGINLPLGTPDDEPAKMTVWGLGNRKNQRFLEILENDGIEAYNSTVDLIKELKAKGIKVGVATSSKNGELVLKKTGLISLIEARVDGVVSQEIGLKGKPAPDIFLEAAKKLGVSPEKSVIVEDATSGVSAGELGRFGLVIGLAREENHQELRANGADVAVSDISEFGLAEINQWFKDGFNKSLWEVKFDDYDKGLVATREAIFAIGNGYFGTRGSFEECTDDLLHYPGTYIAGLYNALDSEVSGRMVRNEDFVNAPNWLLLRFKIDNGEWITPDSAKVKHLERTIDLKNGVYNRTVIYADNLGRETKITSARFASATKLNLGAMDILIEPLNYSGNIILETALDGNVINNNVKRYRELKHQHLERVSEGGNRSSAELVVETNETKIKVAMCSLTKAWNNGTEITDKFSCKYNKKISTNSISLTLQEGTQLKLTKLVAIASSNNEKKEVLSVAKDIIAKVKSYNEELLDHQNEWSKIWDKCDVSISGDRLAQKILRMHIYHLISSGTPKSKDLDFAIPARGLTGESYRGHIFWDEIYISPWLVTNYPEIIKRSLMYRYNRLTQAREYAKEYNYLGAMFPWQSGSKGTEETQVVHFNPKSGKWDPDYSSFQRHVGISIAYNVWIYHHVTDDDHFLETYGAELFLDIVKFFVGLAKFNESTGKWSIKNVMGPDEFHEHHENCSGGGLSDNTYTNVMTAWMIETANNLITHITEETKDKLFSRLGLSDETLILWDQIRSNLNLVIKDGIIAQFDGYLELEEFDFSGYIKKYGNIHRADRILKAEGKSCDDYKVAKQADTLLLFYLLPPTEVVRVIQSLGYSINQDFIQKNFDYYLARTSHGSTLSRVVHSALANKLGQEDLADSLYDDALFSDYKDVQGGTTGEGIHTGVMGATLCVAIFDLAGIDIRNQLLKINPSLPKKWRDISVKINFKQTDLAVTVSHHDVAITLIGPDEEMVIEVVGKQHILRKGEKSTISY
jgi:beta-phosphoglucomutase family hydrolase